MSSFSRTSRGLVVDFAGTAVTLLLGIVVVPLYLTYFGEDGYGLWITVSGLVGMSLLVDSGVSLYLVRELPKTRNIGTNEGVEASLILSNSMAAQFVVVLLAVILCSTLYFSFLFIETDGIDYRSSQFHELILSYFMAQIITLVLSPYRIAIYANQELATYNSISVVNAILLFILPIPLHYLGAGVLSFSLAALIGNSLTDAFSIVTVKKYFPNMRPRASLISRREIRRILFSGGMFTALKAMEIIRLNLARVLIGTMISPSAATAYAVASRAPELAAANASKIGSAILPIASTEAKRNDLPQRRQLSLIMLGVGLRVAGLFCIGIFLLNESFVGLWVGTEKNVGFYVTAGLSLVLALRTVQACIGSILFASSRFGRLPLVVAIETALGIGTAVILLPKIGLLSVVLGLFVAYSASTFYYINFLRIHSELSWRRLLSPSLKYAAPPTITSAIAGGLITVVIGNDELWNFIIVGVIIVGGNLLALEGVEASRNGWKGTLIPRSYFAAFKRRLLQISNYSA